MKGFILKLTYELDVVVGGLGRRCQERVPLGAGRDAQAGPAGGAGGSGVHEAGGAELRGAQALGAAAGGPAAPLGDQQGVGILCEIRI